ncbi:MAG: hypothetical protein RLZZ69_1873, partial [Cyanobacteriota bacterium]
MQAKVVKQYLSYFIPFVAPQVRSWTWEARLLNWLTCVWLIIGLVTLMSASYPEGMVNSNDGLYILKRQMIGVVVGIIGFNLVSRLPLNKTVKIAPLMVLVLLILIFATLIPGLGKTTMGASRWIAIGPFFLQPSELIKPFLVLQAAYIFSRWQKLTNKVRLVWIVVFILILAGILKQPNLSTTGLCGMSLWLIALAAELLDFLAPMVKPGVSTLEINDAAEDWTQEKGAVSAPLGYGPKDNPFTASLCTSVNEVICHGIPNAKQILKDGDIINIDVTPILDGYHGDTSRTFFVGNPSPKAKELVEVTEECLRRGIAAVKPGARICDIGAAIQQYAEQHGYSVVRDFVGHGVSHIFHTAPQIPHYYDPRQKR